MFKKLDRFQLFGSGFFTLTNFLIVMHAVQMNSFTKYDHGTLASAYFEHIRRTDADFRRRIYDLKIAMYKTTYQKEFYWPEHTPKCTVNQLEPEFVTIAKPTEDELRQIYTPRIIHRKLCANKGIEPPLEYSNILLDKYAELMDSKKHAKSLYQESYINRMPIRVNKKEETPEEWVQKWKNECHNVRDADDLVQDLSSRIISSQRILLSRKRVGDI